MIATSSVHIGAWSLYVKESKLDLIFKLGYVNLLPRLCHNLWW
jgi:hypothetical protein